MRYIPNIVKNLREDEKNGSLKLIRKKDIYQDDEIDDIIDSLLFNQWRFL